MLRWSPVHDLGRGGSSTGTILDPAALHGACLGVARECVGQHEGTDPVRTSALPCFGNLELEQFRCGLRASLYRCLQSHPPAPLRSLKERIRFNGQEARLLGGSTSPATGAGTSAGAGQHHGWNCAALPSMFHSRGQSCAA